MYGDDTSTLSLCKDFFLTCVTFLPTSVTVYLGVEVHLNRVYQKQFEHSNHETIVMVL